MPGIFDDLSDEAPTRTAAPALAAGIFDDLPDETPKGGRALTVRPEAASPSTAADLANLAANGFAFGFGDRINMVGDTAVNAARGWLGKGPMEGTSPDYAGNLSRYQDATAGARERHPIAGTIAEIGGSLANPVTYLAAPEAMAATLGGKVLQGAGIGAGFGAVQGAGNSRDLTNLPAAAMDVGLGAGAGGLFGGALPAGAAGLSAAYRRMAGSGEALPDMGKDATAYLMRKYGADDPAAVQARAGQLGPDAMLLDYGANLQGTGMALAARPGEASNLVVRALNDRAVGTNARVGADVDAALGSAQNPSEVRRAIGDTRSAITGPLYADAYGQGQRWTPGLEAVAQRPAVQSAMGDAATAAANKGRPLPSILLDEQGRPISLHAALEAYEARTRPAMDQALADYLGGDGSIATAARIMADRQTAADPLYAQFRSGEIPTSPELGELLRRPSVRGALPGAQRLAQDEGKSIFVPGSRWEPDPVPSGTTPDAPADMTFGPTDNGVRGTAPTRPDVPQPPTLHDIVKSAGGVRDPGGDLKAMGLTDIPGLVASPGKGLSPDAMRKAAAELGYLGPNIDDAMANTTVGHLHDALASEAPVFSVKDQGAVDAWNRYAVARDAWEQQGAPNSRGARPANLPASGLDAGGPPPDGAPVPQITPEGWDYVKRALDDRISTAQRGGSNNEARVYTGLKGQLLGALDQASPVYAQARQAYAGQSDLLDALQAGHGALKSNLTREQMAADFGALGTDGERQFYRLGAAHALREQLAQRGDLGNFVDTVAGNQALRDKLAVLAPTADHAAWFNARLDQARQQFTEAQRPDVRGWHDTLDVLRSRAEGQSGPQQAGTQAAADALAAELGQIPSFARAQQVDADYGRLGTALDDAGTVLRGGPNAMHPNDFAGSFGAMSPAEQAASRIGMRADVDRSMGVRPNDFQAVKSLLQGEDGWNGAKIATAFGPEAQQALNRTVEREGVFSGNQNRIVQNSKTEPLRQAGDDLRGEPWQAWTPFPGRIRDATMTGMALDIGLRKPLNALAAALQKAPDTTLRDIELARAVTARGGVRSALLEQMEARRQAMLAAALQSDRLQEVAAMGRAPVSLALANALLDPSEDRRRRR